jgi:molecular chaperone GrpE (heat shock protein)
MSDLPRDEPGGGADEVRTESDESPDWTDSGGSFSDALGGLLEQVSARELSAAPTEGDDAVRDTSERDVAEQIEEIAEDMLGLIRRVRQIEESQSQVLGLLEQLEAASQLQSRTVAREIDSLRRDMIGERRHSATTDLFNELIPLLDRLQTSSAHLDEDEDARMLAQMEGVIGLVSAALRRLGCLEFDADVGQAFDPATMTCAGYLDAGEPGVVLACVQHGYRTRDVVLRPAGVKLLSPSAAQTTSASQEADLDE